MALFERTDKEILETGGASGDGERKALTVGLGLWVDGNEDIGLADVMVGPCNFIILLQMTHEADTF